jgi:hypothetical protein
MESGESGRLGEIEGDASLGGNFAVRLKRKTVFVADPSSGLTGLTSFLSAARIEKSITAKRVVFFGPP